MKVQRGITVQLVDASTRKLFLILRSSKGKTIGGGTWVIDMG